MVMARPRSDEERSPSGTGGDRRVAARHSPEDVPWIRAVKLSREEARVINVSSGGILIECHARLALGTCTVLQIVGPANRVNIKGHVLRCEVISLAPTNGLLYRVAIAFDPDPCPLPVGSYLSGGADREFPWI